MHTVLGQNKAIATLKQALEDGRKHHAWIFSGPRGVGKYTAASSFAAQIVGTESTRGSTHPDIHVICKEDVAWSQNPALQRRKQTNIPIDLLRERIIGGKTSDDRVHDSAAFKTPVAGSQKVFIIDEAELLDEQGQNALLKTLEEPPLNTTIILITCRDDLLLPTIKSRCSVVGFSYLQPTDMALWAEGMELDVSPSDLAWAIRFSFVESAVTAKLKENSSASKESANRRALELLLLMFGASASALTRSGQADGITTSEIISDIERQMSTNISLKVLVDSLCARWAHLCVGDSVFM
jgi:DNA polymerase III delta prime subunit